MVLVYVLSNDYPDPILLSYAQINKKYLAGQDDAGNKKEGDEVLIQEYLKKLVRLFVLILVWIIFDNHDIYTIQILENHCLK